MKPLTPLLICLTFACAFLLTKVAAQTPTPKTAIGSTLKTLEAQTAHLNYLIVDSALKVGDSSIYIVYATPQDPYNYIYSTDGPLLINGRNGIPLQHTFVNPYGGALGIGFSPTTLPAGSKLAVNGSTYFAGYSGINKIPNQNSRLGIVANTNEVAIDVDHLQTTPYGISIRDMVHHPLAKAFTVVLNDNNPSTPNPESFMVLGNGITNIGGASGAYQELAQLYVQTDLPVGCRVKCTNTLPGKVAFLAEVPSNNTKALSIVNTSVPGSPQEVYRITGAGVGWMQEIRVRVAPFPDYVFAPDYPLMDLHDLDQYIQANHKLPGMPSAEEIEKDSANLGELVRLQQEKIEELTLHLIALQKTVEALQTTPKQ